MRYDTLRIQRPVVSVHTLYASKIGGCTSYKAWLEISIL